MASNNENSENMENNQAAELFHGSFSTHKRGNTLDPAFEDEEAGRSIIMANGGARQTPRHDGKYNKRQRLTEAEAIRFKRYNQEFSFSCKDKELVHRNRLEYGMGGVHVKDFIFHLPNITTPIELLMVWQFFINWRLKSEECETLKNGGSIDPHVQHITHDYIKKQLHHEGNETCTIGIAASAMCKKLLENEGYLDACSTPSVWNLENKVLESSKLSETSVDILQTFCRRTLIFENLTKGCNECKKMYEKFGLLSKKEFDLHYYNVAENRYSGDDYFQVIEEDNLGRINSDEEGDEPKEHLGTYRCFEKKKMQADLQVTTQAIGIGDFGNKFLNFEKCFAKICASGSENSFAKAHGIQAQCKDQNLLHFCVQTFYAKRAFENACYQQYFFRQFKSTNALITMFMDNMNDYPGFLPPKESFFDDSNYKCAHPSPVPRFVGFVTDRTGFCTGKA